MYLRGLQKLRALSQDEGGAFDMYGSIASPGSDSTATVFDAPPVASALAPTAGEDWTGVIRQAIQTFGNFAVAREQSKAVVATAPYTYRNPFGTPYLSTSLPGTGPLRAPGTSPFLSLPVSGTALLIGGALLVGAFLLMKKGK